MTDVVEIAVSLGEEWAGVPPDLAEEAAQLALLDDDHLWRVAPMTVPVEKSERMQIGDLILLTPHQPRVSRLSEQFTAEMDKADLSLAELLAGLAEERVLVHRERESQDA